MDQATGCVRACHLSVIALTNGQWRVSDSSLPTGDSLCVLGFIERKNDGFEAMRIGHGFEWLWYETLGAAIEHFVGLPRPEPTTHALASLRWASH
jgi:hypothetical protein